MPEVPKIEGVNVQNLSIKTQDDVVVSSWFIENSKDKAIILLSGIRGNRTQQLDRARFYLDQGYSVLLPDLRGTGETKGDFISFGWHERKDLNACYKKLKELGFSEIGANGQSLGAATIVYSSKEATNFDFVILDFSF